MLHQRLPLNGFLMTSVSEWLLGQYFLGLTKALKLKLSCTNFWSSQWGCEPLHILGMPLTGASNPRHILPQILPKRIHLWNSGWLVSWTPNGRCPCSHHNSCAPMLPEIIRSRFTFPDCTATKAILPVAGNIYEAILSTLDWQISQHRLSITGLQQTVCDTQLLSTPRPVKSFKVQWCQMVTCWCVQCHPGL